jgi:MAE_28990/MAE_18760-like HEPN
MFSGPIERLRLDTKAIRGVVELHEYSRELFYTGQPPQGPPSNIKDLWEAVRGRDPGRPAWQVYDHCAALLRLYAAYSIFLEDLVADYLRSLPELYENYHQLPDSILKQHRTGFGQIMLKLGDAGPYRHLRESDIILQLSQGVSGARPYTLLKDAFFVDRQNYRTEILDRLFGSLGLDSVSSRIAKHPSMKAFIVERFGNATTFGSELDGFVKLRNEAAHSTVEEVIATSQFLTMADFVLLSCEILTEILSREMLTSMAERQPGIQLGVVEHVYRGGKIAIVKMTPTVLTVGDDIALVRKERIRIAKVLSIQANDVAVDSLASMEAQEVGVRLDQKCRVGEVLRRVMPEAGPLTAQQPLFANEELLATASSGFPSDESDSSQSSPDIQDEDKAEAESE